MDYIRTCDVYPTTRCNCPERMCRREKAEIEAWESDRNNKLAHQRRLDDLIEFQIYLKSKDLINNYDWTFEEEAEKFLNQRQTKYEGN